MRTNSHVKYQYQVCGLRWASNVPLSIPLEPSLDKKTPNVKFTLKSSALSTGELFTRKVHFTFIKNGAGHPSIAVYRVGGLFLLDCHSPRTRVEFVMPRDGRWIHCYPGKETTQEEIEMWLFGLVTSFLLQTRGIFTLHAAAVNCHEQAIAFLGANGYGKSTLAFFFVKNGHSLITDDVLPISERHHQAFGVPGYPSMNLWGRTLAQVGSSGLTAAGINGGKHRYSADTLEIQFCKSEIPLTRIYLLHPTVEHCAERTEIIPVSKRNAIIELFAFTRSSSTIELDQQQRLVGIYGRLLSHVPVRRLVYAAGFQHLPQLYQAILHDLSLCSDESSRASTNRCDLSGD